jgi:hypothetical protein
VHWRAPCHHVATLPRPAQWARCTTTAPRQTFIPALPPRESWLLPALTAPRAHSVALPPRVDSACDRALEPFRPRQVGCAYARVPTPLAFRPHPAAFRSSVSHRGLPCYVSATAAVESPLLTTPSPPCRSRSFTELRSNFPTRRADSFPAGELPRRHHAGELPPHRRPHSSPRDGAPSHVRRFRR